MSNSDNVGFVVGALINLASMNKVETDVELDNFIKEYKSIMLSSRKITEEEYDIAAKELKSFYFVTIGKSSIIIQGEHGPWFESAYEEYHMGYWERYKTWLGSKRPMSVIKDMDYITNKVMDYCGNPNDDSDFSCRGMVIGDVQSGKTANYLGLMCKAADVNYEVFIILTGTTNTLRTQTQKRIDQGFIGYEGTSRSHSKVIGVGNLNKSISAKSYTNNVNDFIEQMPITLDSYKEPLVFVVKKNSNVLDKLIRSLSVVRNVNVNNKIEHPLFMIDDEADYASINTKKDSISAINSKIRTILSMFTKSTYVGFTATPYANIYIDPDAKDSACGSDLFPKDFICCMESPSDYIGAKDIFDPDGRYYKKMVRFIGDISKYLSLKHSKDSELKGIPDSLRQSLNCFVLACAIRDLKGDSDKPMSMMIHMSRYVLTHYSINENIEEEFKTICNDVANYCCVPDEKAMNNSTIKSLYDTWINEYSGDYSDVFSWSQVKSALQKAVELIGVHIINSRNKAEEVLDYDKCPNLRVILIGGDSLSRGLTLEGLMVSYFYRNSMLYDALLQMGRWFGYKNGFENLCRIWISEQNASWFSYIADATEELRDEVRNMEVQRKTPENYGLYVRQDISGLRITSVNKMRDTGFAYRFFSLSACVLETIYFKTDKSVVQENFDLTNDFIGKMKATTHCVGERSIFGSSLIWYDVPRNLINELISEYNFSSLDRIDSYTLVKYINSKDALENWDVVIVHGNSIRPHYGVQDVVRSTYFKQNNGDILLSKSRLITPVTAREGLSRPKAEWLIKEFQENNKKADGSPKAVSQRTFLDVDRKPLLMIHFLDMTVATVAQDEGEMEIADNFKKMGDVVPIGLAFGFPRLSSRLGNEGYCVTNRVMDKLSLQEQEEDYEEEEEEDDGQ